jgi:mannose-binding lectin 2
MFLSCSFFHLVSFCCCFFLTFVLSQEQVHVKNFTFSEPYEVDSSNGGNTRRISSKFEYGGSTEVKKNFIRLTPDRQSKRGYIWSRSFLNANEATFVLKFRIHGQGRSWFGDGIGFWLTHGGKFQNGENHGYIDKYYGIGILLDTFKNIEHKGGHKDVTLQINDGTKTLDDLNEETKIGCDAALRYHSKSASFDPVFSASRLRVKIKENKIDIEIDPHSDGTWTSCYTGELPFSKEWLTKASIGLTASTGSLADNHDILSLHVFDDPKDYALSQLDASIWTHNYSKEFNKLLDSSTCDQNCKISILKKIIDNFHVETEHWFEELKESTQHTIKKLKEKEQKNKEKIVELSNRMTNFVHEKVDQNLHQVKEQMNVHITTNVENQMKKTESSWKIPFFVLIGLLGGFGWIAFQKYQKLVKSHLL